MSITYPDNVKRQGRVYQLGTDTQDYLNEAADAFQQLQDTLKHVNDQIAKIYNQAGLRSPEVQVVDVLKEVGVTDCSTADTVLEVLGMILDVMGFAVEVKYLAPAATKLLIRSGALTAEGALKVLLKVSVPLIDQPVEITVGDLAGQILGAAVGSVAIIGIDLGIETIQGKIEKGELIDAIKKLYPQRTVVRLSQMKTQELLASATAVKTLLDVFIAANIPITDEVIRGLIQKDIQPSLDKATGYTEQSVKQDLDASDVIRGAYMNDDPS